MTVTKHRTCANCGGRAVPIVYGLQTMEGVWRAERGEAESGGCTIIVDESPAWKCSACGVEFGVLRNS